jgi:hypothetical protein
MPGTMYAPATGAYAPQLMQMAPQGGVQMSPMQMPMPMVQQTYMPAPVPVLQATVQGVPVQEPSSSAPGKATNQLTDWLIENNLPISIMHSLSAAGVASVDDLKYLTDKDIETLGLPAVLRNKLRSGTQRLKNPGAPQDDGPASV